MDKSFVYIITNDSSTVFYTGVTSNLKQRIQQHRDKTFGGFSAKYDLKRLVYFEELPNIMSAILREKHIPTELVSHYVSCNVLLQKTNAQNRNRTSDTRIFSPLLYQLSYLGIKSLR